MGEVKLMSLTEFLDDGYLHEINRQLLHPLGLALALDAESGRVEVWDERDDPEGWEFSEGTLDAEKAQRIETISRARRPARVAALGWWVQPVAEGATGCCLVCGHESERFTDRRAWMKAHGWARHYHGAHGTGFVCPSCRRLSLDERARLRAERLPQ